MDTEALTQEEVESLLAAMEDAGERAVSPSVRRNRGKVVPYDFKRPERVGKEQMRALQTMHEGFCRNFGAALSALLRSIVEVKLTSVDQLTYSEFIFSLENPTCFNLLKAEPLDGNLILDINPAILFPMIDRLLGGGREKGLVNRRPLTEIELRLVTRITDIFINELIHAWENVLEIHPEVERIESNPQLVQIVSPNEVVILISFELAMGDSRGMINFCIPYNSIERVSSRLTANNWAAGRRKTTSPESVKKISESLAGSVVELVVELAETQIEMNDLVGLRVGDIITTEKDVHQPLEICVEGQTKFKGTAGAYKGRKAVQIVAVEEEQQEAG